MNFYTSRYTRRIIQRAEIINVYSNFTIFYIRIHTKKGVLTLFEGGRYKHIHRKTYIRAFIIRLAREGLALPGLFQRAVCYEYNKINTIITNGLILMLILPLKIMLLLLLLLLLLLTLIKNTSNSVIKHFFVNNIARVSLIVFKAKT